MADWSQLPEELLCLIAKRLGSSLYQLRFRSVCSSWRSSFTPKPLLLPSRLPFIFDKDTADPTTLSKRTVFLLSPSSSYPRTQTPLVSSSSSSWLVKIEDRLPNQIRLLNPLSRFQIKPFPSNFPKVINLNHFTVIELGHEYVLHIETEIFQLEKTVSMCLDWESCDFALLANHATGKSEMFKSGDNKWSTIHERPFPYDDVVLFRSEFYAVDGLGRTVRVGLDLGETIVANAVSGGHKKFLVESCGGLLLVDMYYDDDDDNDDVFDRYASKTTVSLKVFELDEGEKRWVEVGSLGDRVLFLGDDCKFSASAEGLSGCKGNCVFFTDRFLHSKFLHMSDEEGGDGVFKGGGICVFDLDNGSIVRLADYPEYSKLFWPPPDWVTSTTSEVSIFFDTRSKYCSFHLMNSPCIGFDTKVGQST